MTHARPNAISLAVAIAISTSIISTEALAGFRLETKSVDIPVNGHVEFTQSEIIVQPTLGDDLQPIPKSITTTYPDQTQVRADYHVPSEGFTDALSGIGVGVSSVDLFETDENDVAQKYTKVLKVGNEGVFRFTHNLAEKKLVIEVREGMTSQDSIKAVRHQSVDIEPLEPLTKIASPKRLVGVLKGANERAGSLGEVDRYVALATIKVDKIEVNGRTFMLLMTTGDQTPELQRLGQSLFINDEVLLAAATSAYTQVHVLEEGLQQKALNDLLSYYKPVGYVEHIEDETQTYPVPAGYPKLEVTGATGEAIVFHRLKQNPTDLAFVEGLYKLLVKDFANNPIPSTTTQVKKDKVKGYQYVIRNRQMELLEELAVQQDALLGKAKLITLTYYESIQQALTSATPDKADEFEFTTAHIRLASSVATPTWMHSQLIKYFGFKPVIKNFLTSQLFIQNIQEVVAILSGINEAPIDALGENKKFASKVTGDMAGQLIEIESELKEQQQTTELKLVQLRKEMKHLTETIVDSHQKIYRSLQLRQRVENEFLQTLKVMAGLQQLSHKLQQEVEGIPRLEQQVLDARADATIARNIQMAAELGIDNWDDTQPLAEQARIIRKKTNEIYRAVSATEPAKGQPDEALNAKLAAIEGHFGITPIDENDRVARIESIQQLVQLRAELAFKPYHELSAIIGDRPVPPPVSENQLRALCLTILDYDVQQYNIQQQLEAFQHQLANQQEQEKQQNRLQKLQQEVEQIPKLEQPVRDARAGAKIARNIQMAAELGIDNWDDTQPLEEQARLISLKTQEIKQVAEVDQENFQQQSTGTEAQKIAATIAAHLNIKDFDRGADIETQQKLLVQSIQKLNAQRETLDVHQERILQRVQELNAQSDIDITYDKLMKNALAVLYGKKQPEDSTLEDQITLIEAIHENVNKLASMEEELEDIKTPGHPITRPEVLDKLSAVEEALEMGDPDSEDDEYYRRQAISGRMQTAITEARQKAQEETQNLLKTVEAMLKIEVNEGDDKAKRLDRILTRLDSDDVTEKMLDDINNALWEEDFTTEYEKRKVKLDRLHWRLSLYVEDEDFRITRQQEQMLIAVEDALIIDKRENIAAKERARDLVAKLADDLKIEFEKDASLNEQRVVLRAGFRTLNSELSKPYDDEGIIRERNNKMALRLVILDYKDDAPADDQINLIKETLEQRYIAVFKACQPMVEERIAAIENELDMQMARLGPKPRYVLDRELARAREDTEEAEKELEELHRKLDAIHLKQVVLAESADVPPDRDKIIKALNGAIKQIHARLGLSQAGNQILEDLLNDVERYFQKSEYYSQKEAAIIQQLWTTVRVTNLPFEFDRDNHLDVGNYINAIREYAASHDRNEGDEALGELPETRKKYTQITKFLHEHEAREMALAYAQDEQKQTQLELNTKNQAIEHSKGIDPKTKTKLEQDREVLDLVLRQKKAKTSKAQEALKAHEANLEAIEDDIGHKPAPAARYADRVEALKNKQLQLGGNDGTGGKILQLTQKKKSLKSEVEGKKAELEILREALRAAEYAVENEGGPFQYTPKQVKILADLHAFIRAHPLKKQALEAVIGLAKSAELSGKPIPNLLAFDLDDEFAPIRLQAEVGDDLTFNQASRMVEVFKNLKTAQFTFEPLEDQSQNPLEAVQKLADRARTHIKSGPQQYDDEILGMGEAAIHFVEHEPGDLKSFSEYFATYSASGNRIIALLREGLISKFELENYMKAVRGVDGYQTVDEFEHFLGYKQGVRVPEFRKVVRMLSDEGFEEFIQNAFTPVTMTATSPAGMKESVAGMKEYAAAVITNYVLDDIAFDNGRRTAAFLTNVQDTLTPYANAAGMPETALIKIIHDTLMQAHAAAVERQLNDYWVKPSAFLAQAVTWYFSSYKPLLVTRTALEAVSQSLSNMAFLYLLDLTNRGDYTHRMLTPFQHWLERYSVDLDRTRQYAYHSGIEKISEVGGLAMPLGKAASSAILLRTGSMLFARQYNANPHMYRSISRLVPEMLKSMATGQGVQVPLLHRITPEKVKTLASATAGLVLGPVATAGTYAHSLVSGFTYAQTFGFALVSSLGFDFFMNDNKILTQWLGGPMGRSLDKLNRWRGEGETESEYVKRTAIATPQRFNETDEEYDNRVKTNNMTHGWMRKENYLQFRERRDRTMKMYEHGWEKYFRDNVPKWSFSHADSIPYSYTLGTFYEWQHSGNSRATGSIFYWH